jgi:quercetin dioxygenase-like cupin family protein
MPKIPVPGCSETFVETLCDDSDSHVLKVEVNPGGEIPLHSHECAATMVVLHGEALAVGIHPRRVQKGDVIVKAPNEPHGFSEITAPFVFISISDGDGIKRGSAEWDINYSG